MKKVLLFFLIAAVWAGAVWCDDFQPSVLDIRAPELLWAEFYINKSSEMYIDILVSGAPVTAWMVITTYNRSDHVRSVQNGNLGWHYMNQIDTTLYISPSYDFDTGEQVIPWDGRTTNGDYYLPHWDPKYGGGGEFALLCLGICIRKPAGAGL